MTRDLSGFRIEPPSRTVNVPPPVPPPPTPPAPDPRTEHSAPASQTSRTHRSGRPVTEASARAASTGDSGPVPRRKVMTALAAELHRRLRTEAEARGVYKADVVLDAYDRHAESMRRDHRASAFETPRRARRRRAVEDATQCQLYVTNEERARIDNLAVEIGLSRSELVSRLVELELANPVR